MNESGGMSETQYSEYGGDEGCSILEQYPLNLNSCAEFIKKVDDDGKDLEWVEVKRISDEIVELVKITNFSLGDVSGTVSGTGRLAGRPPTNHGSNKANSAQIDRWQCPVTEVPQTPSFGMYKTTPPVSPGDGGPSRDSQVSKYHQSVDQEATIPAARSRDRPGVQVGHSLPGQRHSGPT